MILIKGAQIIDGTGKPPFKADILIKDDRISAIGSFPSTKANIIIDGLGLIAAPGFIDVNTDSDHYLSLFTNPQQKDFLLQGVTTTIGGQCGASLAPLLYGSLKSMRKWADIDKVNVNWTSIAELKSALKSLKLGVNFATLAGHSTIRRDISSDETRDLTVSEFEVFKNALKQAIREGALGLSTGLGYAFSRNISYFEIRELLAAVAKYGGIYTTHLRDEKNGIVASVQETIRVAEETRMPTIISHFRPIMGFENQYKAALELIEKNLDKGNIYFDMNIFDVNIMPIYTLLPIWAQRGLFEEMVEVIADPIYRPKILDELSKSEVDLNSLIIAEAKENHYVVGKTVKEFSENRGLDICEGLLLLMEITRMKSRLFYKNINVDLSIENLFHPRSLIGSNSASLSDSQAILKLERSKSTFMKFLEIAAEKKVPMEEAIKKITSVPAKIFNIQKRGVLAGGWFADIVMLKNNKPVNLILNGKLAIKDGELSGERAGLPI